MQMPTQIEILSAGAVKPGLLAVVAAFREETGREATVFFSTAPAIAERIRGGGVFDVVIAPPRLLDDLIASGHLFRGDRIIIGRIGVGVLVRAGAPLLNIAGVEEFKQTVKSADSLVYNQASTGIYLSALFESLGIGADLGLKSVRYPDFAGVLDHIRQGSGRELGFGATTVIIENRIKGIEFAGPLPEKIQNYTTYAATSTRSANSDAMEFFRYLASTRAKSIFIAAGIT
jgi:molybdate transport system substrate-binding protein